MLKRIGTTLATFAAFFVFAISAVAVDGVSFGTTIPASEVAPSEATSENAGNGVNDIHIEYRSDIDVQEGARVIMEGETENAAEIFVAINDPEVKRYQMQGIVYGQGGNALENAYKDIKDGDRKSIDAAVNSNNRIVQALTVAASDPTLPLAKMDRLLQSIEGYGVANTFLLAKYGSTEVVQTEEKPNPFGAENHGLDITDVIVFAGLVILLWILSRKIIEKAKGWNTARLAKKEAKAAEEVAMAEALREKHARESGTSRSRNRRRNRQQASDESDEGTTPGQAQAVEA